MADNDLQALQDVRDALGRAKKAAEKLARFSQAEIDRVAKAMCMAAARAPERSVQCLTNVTLEATNALMRHRLTGIILATGGPDLVKAAYSSGKPALGVGSGNPPAIVDKTADVRLAARMIVSSQTFDNGT